MHHKVFPAELDYLYEMLAFIKEYGMCQAIPSFSLDQIVLAAEEALVNIINYGYPHDKRGTIEIICEETHWRQGVKVIIKDKGIPFNPLENIPPLFDLNEQEEENSVGGYGIYILIGLMDHVEYERIEGRNVLSLTKYV